MSYFLGIDTSTTATKALLVDAGGQVVSVASSEYTYETPRPLWAEQHPDLVQRMVAEGHQLMNHTYDHASFTGYSPGTAPLTTDERRREIERTEAVIGAIAGAAGVRPTHAAVAAGRTVALANKECLVSAGPLFMRAIQQANGTLLPVDSEHNAIFQVLDRNQASAVERVILTASGGPFRTWSLDQMAGVTVETARAHPNWSMGLKISIDSASMFNKALEVIETREFFDVSPEHMEVTAAPEVYNHPMVGFPDGAVLSHLRGSNLPCIASK